MGKSNLNNDDTQKRIQEELSGESERGCAIVGIAYLDDLLLQLLEQYLIENPEAYHDLLDPDNGKATLSSFGSKIIMAYAIGILSTTDLEALRKLNNIRNRFAHKMDMSFSNTQIVTLTQKLTDLLPKELFIFNFRDPRQIFILAVGYFSGRFLENLYIIKKHGITGGFSSVVRMHMSKKDI